MCRRRSSTRTATRVALHGVVGGAGGGDGEHGGRPRDADGGQCGVSTIRVTATNPGGLSAAQSFTVTVLPVSTRGFTDVPIPPGVTTVRARHFTEQRERIDDLRAAAGLGQFRWTDPALGRGVTPVRLVHLTELRSALAAAYTAAGRSGSAPDGPGAGAGAHADPGGGLDGAAGRGGGAGIEVPGSGGARAESDDRRDEE